MRDTNPRQHRQVGAIALILVSLFLWGCSDKPQKKASEPTAPVPKKQQAVTPQETSLELPSSQFSAQFNRAEQALTQFDWMQASVALQEIPTAGLAPNDKTYRDYLLARIAYIRGDQAGALAQLQTLNYQGTHPALRYRILSFKQHILEIQRDSLASARLADEILREIPGEGVPAWKRKVWRNLERTDSEQLSAALPGAMDAQWRGWLELALISRQSTYTASSELSRWQTDHPEHPAANPLPGGLDYLLASTPRGGKVALLLPLSGSLAPAGRAVLDGFLAAYYAASAEGGAPAELLVMDLDKQPSASSAYDEAVRQGVTLVVGPLSKEALADLATRLERPVPILALNRIDQVLPASGSALVQLSLSPEDEAESVAELAFGKGARQALILTPQGDWGSKIEKALLQRWTALGGKVVSRATYGSYDEYSSSLATALALDASEQREKDVRGALGTNIEFVPRRRQDADVVFLLSHTGAEARAMRPLLEFHYAGNLPVWAISSIYSGVPDERNQDLNGLHLVEIPWLLNANPGLREAIAAGNAGKNSYTRLNALGADAFLLQSGFARLQGGADALLRGNTGLLSMDPNLRIQRELSPATFDGGALIAQ